MGRRDRAWPRSGVNAPLTSSAGRLFDAVAALLGVRDTINYEGQAAIELEQLADPARRGSYPAPADPRDSRCRSTAPTWSRAAADDLAAGVPRAVIAARFHNGVAALIADGLRGRCASRRAWRPWRCPAGVFQNLLLTRPGGATGSRHAGFRVLTHSQVPCNDGGISLGQAAVAARATSWRCCQTRTQSSGGGIRRPASRTRPAMPSPVVADSCSSSASGATRRRSAMYRCRSKST